MLPVEDRRSSNSKGVLLITQIAVRVPLNHALNGSIRRKFERVHPHGRLNLILSPAHVVGDAVASALTAENQCKLLARNLSVIDDSLEAEATTLALSGAQVDEFINTGEQSTYYEASVDAVTLLLDMRDAGVGVADLASAIERDAYHHYVLAGLSAEQYLELAALTLRFKILWDGVPSIGNDAVRALRGSRISQGFRVESIERLQVLREEIESHSQPYRADWIDLGDMGATKGYDFVDYAVSIFTTARGLFEKECVRPTFESSKLAAHL